MTALQNMAEAFLPLLKSGVDVLIAFDWTPIVAKVQAFGNALSNIPFEDLLAWVRRLSILVVAFATRDLQVTLVNAFMKAAAVGKFGFSKHDSFFCRVPKYCGNRSEVHRPRDEDGTRPDRNGPFGPAY